VRRGAVRGIAFNEVGSCGPRIVPSQSFAGGLLAKAAAA
jgi:hypothetical protein